MTAPTGYPTRCSRCTWTEVRESESDALLAEVAHSDWHQDEDEDDELEGEAAFMRRYPGVL